MPPSGSVGWKLGTLVNAPAIVLGTLVHGIIGELLVIDAALNRLGATLRDRVVGRPVPTPRPDAPSRGHDSRHRPC